MDDHDRCINNLSQQVRRAIPSFFAYINNNFLEMAVDLCLDIGVYFIKADAGEFSSLMFNGTQANALIVLTGQATVNEPFNNHKRPSPGNSSCNEGPSKRVMEARNASADMASSAPVMKGLMETKELIRKCKAINLGEGENSRVAIGEVMKGKGRKFVFGCLLGKVLHPRGVNGRVEEVDADEEGECIGQYARVRISIDITQPLKKIIYIEHARGEEISIPVVYERLPEFYFCCGRIGHPYKECDKYEGQPKDELAYRVWMQVVQFYGKPRVNRSHERGNMVVANWPITQQRQGYHFTWSNGRFGQHFVEERLDRFLCNKEWREKYVDCVVVNLETWTSDHCPIIMEVQAKGNGLSYTRRSTSRIHYEDAWSSYEACKDIIDKEWRRHGNWRGTITPLNHTYIAMVSKINKPRKVSEFRPISLCNALVAKQSWRIIQFPKSLVARVLQARYFKDNQFLTAKLGSKPSFIWRSILWGRQVIYKGIRWRIGNGQQVQIYQGNWIPRPTSFKPVSPPSLSSDIRVAELINEDNQWNEDLIYQHFLREDVDTILRIPIPSTPMGDQILWHYDKKRIYNVKSGYQVALRINFPDTPTCSEQPTNQWSIIWSMSLPEKIKIFIWRAAKNILPIAENLWRRKIVAQPECQIYGISMETVGHALVECKSARKIWKTTKFAAELRNIGGHDILGILHELVKRLGKSDTELVVAILWVIWGLRNQGLFKGKREDPCISAAKAEPVVESFRRIQAVNMENHLVGLGIVIRDANKNFVAAAVKTTKLHNGVTFAEAEAMNWGLKVAYDAGLANIIIESDSLEAVDYVNNRKSSRTEIQWLISEVQNRLKEFRSWKTLHTPRSCNAIAHSLVTLALEKCITVVWIDSYPSEVMNLLNSFME
ncbi:putative reverse transcriptase/RNA-dependent DNA polymerase [Citrus sinensis]|nr:putative reverse transcriptase/RNA-dependent DNA polymerase [Citrus sinensis]